MVLLLLGSIPTTARAQGFDGTGSASPPDGATVADGLHGWSARFPGAPVVGLTGWAVDAPLVQRLTDGTAVEDQPLVDDLFGTSVQALVPLSSRIAVGLDAPIWLASGGAAAGGPAPGDWAVTVPVRILEGSDAARLLVVPGLRVPTGAEARWLGDPSPVGGLTVSAGTELSFLALAADLGLEGGAATGVPDWPGGLVGTYDADLGLLAGDTFGFHAELYGRAPMFRSLPGVPSELFGSVRVRPADRILLTAGAGSAVTRGVGAAALRMAVGLRVGLGRSALDAAPVPEGASPYELHVVDELRWPIRGASVVVGGDTIQTDDEGYADIPVKAERLGKAEVTADGFDPASVDLEDGRTWWEVTLRRSPVPVAVSVVGPEGSIAGATVRIEGGDGVPGEPVVDEGGTTHVDLHPGTWTITTSAPGMGEQQRTVVIDPTRTEAVRVDSVLAPTDAPDTKLSVKVVDRHGVPVEDAVVAIGDRDLGTTGTGGDLVVSGLPLGDTAVQVSSPRIGEATVLETTIVPGTQEVQAVLEWPAGAVLVKATDAQGHPVDARVAFAGPAPLPSRSLGSDGEELLVLRPGDWTLLVSAPTLGSQERTLVVGDQPGEAQAVDLVLRGDEAGEADLELTVHDVDGHPVGDAEVRIDGDPVGRTTEAGDLTLRGLAEGLRFLEVEGDLVVPLHTEVDLVAGRQREDLVVWSTTGALDVSVTDAGGDPVDALVAFSGPAALPSMHVGADGRESTVLPPGHWQVAVSHPAYGTRVQEVVVTPDERRRHVLDVRLAPEVEQTAKLTLEVRDPDGHPVDARVLLDGAPVGEATAGELVAEGLPLGGAELEVEADGLLPDRREVELAADTHLEVPLAWAPGALEVDVSGPDGPVDAALVALAGSEAIPSRQTEGGVVRFAAKPGAWWIMASHPDFGVAEQQVTLPEAPGLTKVTLTLGRVDPRDAQLVVSVHDEEGHPLQGVAVAIDGKEVGETSAGGTFALAGRPEGKATLSLAPAPGFVGTELPVQLDRGQQDVHTVILPHAPSEVTVEVTGGEVKEVVAHGSGQEVRAPVEQGHAELALPPGTWTLVADTPEAVGSAQVVVKGGQPASASITVAATGTTVSDGQVRLVHPILFDLGSAALRPEATELLDDVARRLLVDRAVALVEVQGHTSEEGGVAFNQQLSEDRARAVRDALVARGVEPERLIPRGYGLSRPVTTGHDEAARQLNRRVELVVLDQE